MGGAGNDSAEGSYNDDYLDGGAGNDYLDGGEGNDYLNGGAGNDYLYDTWGDSILIGGAGDDSLLSDWNSSLDGGSGDDQLTSYGDSTLIGGKGNDSLNGYGDNNSFKGGAGDDTLSGWGNSYLDGGSGNDIYVVNSEQNVIRESSDRQDEIDTVQSNIGSYTLGANVENLTLMEPFSYENSIIYEIVSVIDPDENYDVTVSVIDTPEIYDGNLVGLTPSSEETVGLKTAQSAELVDTESDFETGSLNGTGNSLNNIITGNSLDNYLEGQKGDDSLIGGEGDDILVGYGGSKERDILTGGEGNDTFILGDNRVFYRSNGDSDYAVIADLNSADKIILSGSSDDYILNSKLNSVGSGASDTGIYTEQGDLIALIEDSNLITSMDSNIFNFV